MGAESPKKHRPKKRPKASPNKSVKKIDYDFNFMFEIFEDIFFFGLFNAVFWHGKLCLFFLVGPKAPLGASARLRQKMCAKKAFWIFVFYYFFYAISWHKNLCLFFSRAEGPPPPKKVWRKSKENFFCLFYAIFWHKFFYLFAPSGGSQGPLLQKSVKY